MVVVFYFKERTGMTEEKFNQVYGPAVSNISSQQDITEQESRIEKNQADIKIQQQNLELQQQQQDTQHLMVVGGLAISGVLVLIVAIYLFAKLRRKKTT